jgi:predicted nucleic acid-binding protein
VKIVADSSPLIVLAKLSLFDLLSKLYPRVYISAEVVVAGAPADEKASSSVLPCNA